MRPLPRTCRQASAAAAAACAALLATACSAPAVHTSAITRHDPAQRAATGAPSAASPVASAPAPGPGTSSPVPSPSPLAPAGTGQCPTSALRGSIGQANGAAGSIYFPLEFTNVSGDTCTMFGYPGVSFVTGPSGSELGGGAVRNPTFAPQSVTLDPGATAHATLQVAIAENYPRSVCDPVTAHWLRVYPPDQFDPLYIRFTAATCTGSIEGGTTLGIYVVRPGSTGP